MELHLGNAAGAAVDCWYSSPQKPTNPDSAPAQSFCLIPKNPLQPKTRYTAVATWEGLAKPLQWAFTTR
jgi:hypothetical protein